MIPARYLPCEDIQLRNGVLLEVKVYTDKTTWKHGVGLKMVNYGFWHLDRTPPTIQVCFANVDADVGEPDV